MDATLLQRLTTATTDTEREAIVMEMSLSALPTDVRQAIEIAAIPHWFDSRFLVALVDNEEDVPYESLIALSFVEQIPSKGYAIHERTRRQLLHNLWQDDPQHFQTLSRRAADYCETQAQETDDAPEWEAEATYHRLVSDPEQGVAGLRRLATKWANYEYHTYEEIERTLRWAKEQVNAGRLTGSGADWTRLWQVKLALMYGRPDLVASTLDQITTNDPYLLAEIDQTRGDAFAQTGNQEEMAKAWQSAYDRYWQFPNGQGQLDAYLVADKMRQQGLAVPEASSEAVYSSKEKPSANTLQLIDNISYAWIEGVLKTTLKENIDLRLDRAGNQASNLVYHRQDGMDRNVAGGRLSRLFTAAGESLLILGAPASGKTITLLQLLEELLDQAKQDASVPVPLLFNLSSFGVHVQEKDGDLLSWLADQAYDQYRLNRKVTRTQLTESGKFTLLLDGLDEIPGIDGQREQCVTAINEFAQAYPCGVVVCSRIGDYEALHNKLQVSNALVLQPLTNRQIETFLEQVGGDDLVVMQEQLQNDWQLREALRSPLLLNLYPQVFTALPASLAKTISEDDTVESRRKALFATYVDTVFDSEEKDAEPTKKHTASKEQSVHWLSFLSDRLQRSGTSLFYIEEMQPSWLPSSLMGRYRALYGLFNGSFNGLILGLSAVLGIVPRDGLDSVPSNGLGIVLILGLIFGLGGTMATWLTTKIKQAPLRMLTAGLIVGLIFVLIFVLTSEPSDGLTVVLLFGSGIVFSTGVLANWAFFIRLREKISFLWPSLSRVWVYLKRAAFFGLIFGLIFELIFGLIGELIVGPSDVLIFVLSDVLIIGLIIGLSIGFVLAFLDTPPVDRRLQPEIGVGASLRNTLRITLLATLLFGLPALLVDFDTGGEFLLLFIVLANILPPTFTWFGGLAWCQHWALRIVIARQGWLPFRLVPWLDDMTERGLLRRVGGGYIFIHRSLLEYFAALEEW